MKREFRNVLISFHDKKLHAARRRRRFRDMCGKLVEPIRRMRNFEGIAHLVFAVEPMPPSPAPQCFPKESEGALQS